MIEDTWGNYLKDKLEKNADRMAIIDIGQNARYTYRDLAIKTKCVEKAFLGYGVKRGSHVALAFPTNVTWVAIFLALINIGAVPVCLNSDTTDGEIRYRLLESDARIVLTDEETYTKIRVHEEEVGLDLAVLVDRRGYCSKGIHCNWKEFIGQGSKISNQKIAEAEAKVKYDDILAIQFTSGTTHTPKAVMSVHYKVLNNVKVYSEIMKYTKDDIILSAMPMYHMMGCFYNCLLTFMVGGCLILIDKFRTNRVIETLITEKCTSFHGVPTMYKLIMNKMGNKTFTNLKKGMIAGSYCDMKTIEGIKFKMGIKNIFQAYGQSEGGAYTVSRLEDPVEKTMTTVGRAIEGIQIKIVDEQMNVVEIGIEGEVVVKSDYCMAGYYKNEEETNEIIRDGWIYTGDLGKLDEEGYLIITGRKKDLIIRGGENISPVEIENTLREQEKIKDVVVVGVPDEIMGQEIGAFIIADDEAKETLMGEIMAYITKTLPKHKRPKYIHFLKEFPLTGSGKVQKFKLVESIDNNTMGG